MRDQFFAFRVRDEERRLIEFLAKRLQRSQSDAVRFVVINAARELAAQEDDSILLAVQDVEGISENER